MAIKAKGKKNSISVDMTGVDSRTLVPEGDYNVQVVAVEHKIAESSGKPTLSWEFSIIGGDHEGSKLWYNTSLQPQALFNLKNLLISLGMPVPNSKLNLDLDDLPGRECGVTVEHEVYDGKKKAKITDIFPLESDEDIDEGDEEDDTEESEDDEEEDVDYSELSLAELKELCKERGIKVMKKDTEETLIEKLEAADDEENI